MKNKKTAPIVLSRKQAVEIITDYVEGEKIKAENFDAAWKLAISSLNQEETTIDTCKVTTDGYSYDAPIYTFECLSCGSYFRADKRGTFCPNCGRKISEAK